MRTALFIDGANMHAACRSLAIDVDYKALLAWAGMGTELVRAYYYTALNEDMEYQTLRPLVDWLEYNGYNVVTKPTKSFTTSDGRTKVKGNMDIEMVVDMITLAPRLDRIILVSGDGDFSYAVSAIQRLGVQVYVMSSMKTDPPMLADDLRRRADHVIEIENIRGAITRVGNKRPVRDPVDAGR